MSEGNEDVQLGVTGDENGAAEEDIPQRRVVEIFGDLADVLPYTQPVYCRTIETRLVTFTCAGCTRTVTPHALLRRLVPLPGAAAADAGARAASSGTAARHARRRGVTDLA